MQPGIVYRLNWQAFHETDDIQCYVDIGDMANLIPDDQEPAFYNLIPTESPVILSVIDNDEDPFTVIKAKQLTIKFVNEQNYNISTFALGEDDRWFVHYYITSVAYPNNFQTETVFKGYLVMDDIQEPLLPYGEVVTLTASDFVGVLKDVPLVDLYDRIPVGKYKISELIAMCLRQTGLSLHFRVAFNIKLAGYTTPITNAAVDEHFFTLAYLDAKTFEDEPDKYDDCYTVLEKILGQEARLFQHKGYWYILRVDEQETLARGLYFTEFDENGDFVDNEGATIQSRTVCRGCDLKLINESSMVKISRPHKSVRLDYEYISPRDLPDNASLSAGALVQTVSPTQKRFEAVSWRATQDTQNQGVPAFTAFIERTYDVFGYETERYLLLTCPVAPTSDNFVQSSYVPVGEKDRFTFSVDFRLSAGVSSGATYTQRVFRIRLFGDDGTYWNVDSDGVWYQSNAGWSVNLKAVEYQFIPNNTDETKFTTVTVEAQDVPTAGRLVIDLHAFNQQGGAFDDRDIHFNNINFDYTPYINGSYFKRRGHCHEVTQSGDYKAARVEQVYIADSPRKIYKGALHKLDSFATILVNSTSFNTGNTFQISGYHADHFFVGMILKISGTVSNNITTRVVGVQYSIVASATIVDVEDSTVSETVSATFQEPIFSLANSFYNAAVFPSGPPDSSYNKPYGETQVFDVWNQFNRPMRVIQGELFNLSLNAVDIAGLPDVVDLIQYYQFNDPSTHLYNKGFHLLTFEQDHDTQQWSGTFREAFDTSEDKQYTGHVFKYLE